MFETPILYILLFKFEIIYVLEVIVVLLALIYLYINWRQQK